VSASGTLDEGVKDVRGRPSASSRYKVLQATHSFCTSPSADGRGGLTSGTPKQPGLEHSSASIAHPLRGAKTGELRVLETSVGGVEERKLWLPAEASSLGVDGRAFGPAIPSVIEGGTEVEGLD